ncbi:MAG TPA: hotdog domain-containing protein [Chloroflexota bacterium]|nr:hotdog domain-containing protein [Chloroflexota bacterium]HEX2987954.1 hotdog domain-containing protein [Chloroflexota bacterium]
MEARRVSDSRSQLSQFMLAPESNPWGQVHGGSIMKLVDNVGGVAAMRHCHMPVVTAQFVKMNFLQPVALGAFVTARASLTGVGRTSMEIRVTVEAENLLTGEVVQAAKAEAVYVALGEDGRPAEVPRLILEADEARRPAEGTKQRRASGAAELAGPAMI